MEYRKLHPPVNSNYMDHTQLTAAIPPNYDVRRVAKTHFIIFARQFVESFAEYFDDCEAIQDVKFQFLALYNDVPTALDPENFTELLYTFTELGDEKVTTMLSNFGTFIRPFKPYIEKRDPAVWALLADLPEAQDNLIEQLQIADKWAECDLETHQVIWESVEVLLYYGSMYTTYGQIPETMMESLNKCAQTLMEKNAAAGTALTEAELQASLTDLGPQIMANMKPDDLLAFGQQMMSNPSMMQDLMGMARNVHSAMPGINTQDLMQKMMPGGMEGMQQMMATMSGGGGGAAAMASMTPEQIAHAQTLVASMMNPSA